VILLTEYHAVKPIFDKRNPPAVDEFAIAVKSCFAGVKLDGFDFIQGLPWISSERSEDFIVDVQRFH